MELRIINLLLSLWLIWWSFRWYKDNHGAELYAFPTALLGLHMAAFYITTILHAYNIHWIPGEHHASALNAWSNGIRLHGLVTTVLLAYSLKRIRARTI